MTNKLASTTVNGGTIRGQGFLGFEDQAGEILGPGPFFRLGTLISSVLGILTIIAIIWLLLKLFTGAIGILNSGGDKAKLQSARGNITFAIIGFVVVISAYFLIAIIGTITGLPLLETFTWYEIFTNLVP